MGEHERRLEERRMEESRPLEESGQGVFEGFEQAKKDLEEHASHGDPAPDPEDMAGRPEDPRAAEADYGEADEIESTEREERDGEGDSAPVFGAGAQPAARGSPPAASRRVPPAHPMPAAALMGTACGA